MHHASPAFEIKGVRPRRNAARAPSPDGEA